MNFISDTKFQPSKNWPFNYHILSYLLQTTAVKCNAHPSNKVNYFKMFYVIVIILRGLLQDLLIRYNHNTMVEIDTCL